MAGQNVINYAATIAPQGIRGLHVFLTRLLPFHVRQNWNFSTYDIARLQALRLSTARTAIS